MARILAPFQGAVAILSVYQGLRSFHSLNPWLFSFHAFRREHKPADSRSLYPNELFASGGSTRYSPAIANRF